MPEIRRKGCGQIGIDASQGLIGDYLRLRARIRFDGQGLSFVLVLEPFVVSIRVDVGVDVWKVTCFQTSRARYLLSARLQ